MSPSNNDMPSGYFIPVEELDEGEDTRDDEEEDDDDALMQQFGLPQVCGPSAQRLIPRLIILTGGRCTELAVPASSALMLDRSDHVLTQTAVTSSRALVSSQATCSCRTRTNFEPVPLQGMTLDQMRQMYADGDLNLDDEDEDVRFCLCCLGFLYYQRRGPAMSTIKVSLLSCDTRCSISMSRTELVASGTAATLALNLILPLTLNLTLNLTLTVILTRTLILGTIRAMQDDDEEDDDIDEDDDEGVAGFFGSSVAMDQDDFDDEEDEEDEDEETSEYDSEEEGAGRSKSEVSDLASDI